MDPECPLTGHSTMLTRVAFSHDGAQVVSTANSLRVWDVASGRQVRHFEGGRFALVECVSGEYKQDCYVITTCRDTLRICKVGTEQQDAEGGAAAAYVACFRAPQHIAYDAVRCVGAKIIVGCKKGAVCILSAPFLAA